MPNKRALIVEGGGMRGAHSAGVLAALSERVRPHFDVILGSSAGACTVAFWVSQQFDVFERIWSHYLHDAQFIRFRHLVLPGTVMDLDYLLDDVFVNREPLDTKRILASEQDFFIAVTHCESGEAHYLHNKNKIDVLTALKASASMPLAARLPSWYRGEPFADGGIAASIPLEKALEENCDEFWIVLTQPRGFRKKKTSQLPWPRWLFRRYPQLAEALIQRNRHYNEILDKIEALEAQNKAFVIRPSRPLPVSRFTRDRDRIRAAIALGRQDTASFLDGV